MEDADARARTTGDGVEPPRRPVALIVLDGFGLAPDGPGNAVASADTPTFDRLWEEASRTTLSASGRAVGLPDGQMGNSEVGHMNLGSGRVVQQSLSFIQDRIDDGTFFENAVLNAAFEAAEARGGSVHLMGLVSRGGVHSDLEHLFALLELARRRGGAPVRVHAFTDGRDAPPDSGRGYLGELLERIDALDPERMRVASVVGRYFAMDRDRRWERTRRAHDAVVCGRAEHAAPDALAAIDAAYARGETDEFVAPTVITDDAGAVGTVEDGDAVVWFNFRADRARQLSHALLGGPEWDAFERCRAPSVHYASLMEYDVTMETPFAFELPEVRECLAQVLAERGLRQFHAAETEKYPHVTYFFNAKIEDPFPGEEREIVPSPQVATYDLQPQMSAPELTEVILRRLRDADDDFLLVNYANPDMVGHTGVLEAAIAACEEVDRDLGRIVEEVLGKGGACVVLADHGNAETMIDADGGPHTAHTTNPVPCLVVGAGPVLLRDGGVLGDVAPTVLDLLGLPQPEAMTGRSLLAGEDGRP